MINKRAKYAYQFLPRFLVQIFKGQLTMEKLLNHEAVTTSGPPWFLLLPFSVSSFLPASFPSPLPLPPPPPLPLPTLWHPFHPLNLFCRQLCCLYLSSFILSTPKTSFTAVASVATYPKSCPYTPSAATASAAI